MKPIAKPFLIISLVLSLLIGGTLASAHSYDHLIDDSHAGHNHPPGQAHSSWLGGLIHPEEEEQEHECDLLHLGALQALASSVFFLPNIPPVPVLSAPVQGVRQHAAVRLRPPSRAPPSFTLINV